jgi:hypothetical protein
VLIQCFFTFVFVVKIGVKTFQNIESNYNLFDLADKIINVNWIDRQDLHKFRRQLNSSFQFATQQENFEHYERQCWT